MTQFGLTLIAPDLVDLFKRIDEEGRRHAGTVAAHLAVERAGLRNARIDHAESALASGLIGDLSERAAIQGLTEELDDVAWNIQERAESGAGTWEEYLQAFAQARAAAAVGFALAALVKNLDLDADAVLT